MTRDVRTWVLAWIEAGKICSSTMAPFGSEAKESAGHRCAPCLACVKGEAPHTSLEVFWGICLFLWLRMRGQGHGEDPIGGS